ncbi:MAG: hypothetical protein P0S93_02040 [Candidatus Neptunochlamydia sp.]|nr:hypothetical protein [Candidatus Neptunochlamydia sp.]
MKEQKIKKPDLSQSGCATIVQNTRQKYSEKGSDKVLKEKHRSERPEKLKGKAHLIAIACSSLLQRDDPYEHWAIY